MAISFDYETYLLGIIPFRDTLADHNTAGYHCTAEDWREYFDYVEENLNLDRFSTAFISNTLHANTAWWLENYFLDTIFTKDFTTELEIEKWDAFVCQYKTVDGIRLVQIRNRSNTVRCYLINMVFGQYLFSLRPISGTDEGYGLFDDPT